MRRRLRASASETNFAPIPDGLVLPEAIAGVAPGPSRYDMCEVPEYSVDDVLAGRVARGVPQDPIARTRDFFFYVVLLALPVAGPLVAFCLWQPILAAVHLILGEEKNLLELTQVTLTPTTNGIVVASLGTALGTLISITVWSLRTRQLDIRTGLNKEACELKLLEATLIASLAARSSSCRRDFDPCNAYVYLQVLALTRMYVSRIVSESSSDVNIYELERQGVGDTELAGIIRTVNSSTLRSQLPQDLASRITRLNDARSMRLAALNTAFPFIHWVILALLACSIAVCFVVEVDQSEGRFLSERPEDSFRLRLVFTILVGTFSGLTSLCADLSDPFRGSFTISGTTKQFVDMVAAIDADIALIRGGAPEDVERELTG